MMMGGPPPPKKQAVIESDAPEDAPAVGTGAGELAKGISKRAQGPKKRLPTKKPGDS